MPLELSRTIPAHKKTLRVKWCKRDFMKMSQRFRAMRAKAGDRVDLERCYWCKRKHLDGDMMALAYFSYIGNRTLCQKCADELIGDVEEPDIKIAV